jgi:conjugal transfer/entry exclusion protein
MARAEEVKSQVDTLTERVNSFIKQFERLFDELNTAHKQTAQTLTEHRLKYTEEIGRLVRAAEDLNKLLDRQQSAEETIATLKSICQGLSGWKER